MADPIPVWPGKLVGTGAGEVFVRIAPAATGAEPALFVHGLGGSSTNWTDLMDALRLPGPCAADRPAVACPVLAGTAVDLPGFGFSPPPARREYSITGHAKAVIALIERQDRGPVHLIANSLGGAVCTRVAGRRPDLVRTLTLISPALPDLRPRLLPVRLVVGTSPVLGPRIIAWLVSQPAEKRTNGAIGDLYWDPSLVHRQRWHEEVEELRRRDQLMHANDALIYSARSLVTEYFRAGGRSLWRDALASSAPALIMYGSHDRLVRAHMAGKAARMFGDAQVLVLPQVGHVAMMEQPDLVARHIRDFLVSLPGSPSGSSEISAPGAPCAGLPGPAGAAPSGPH